LKEAYGGGRSLTLDRTSHSILKFPFTSPCRKLINRILSFEDLHHELRLNLIQLLQRHLQSRSVFIRSSAEDAFEAKGGAPHEQFSIS